jgi:hypothetical protein
MSGFISVGRYTNKMTISEQDILHTLMKSRDRIAAAAWVLVRDAHAAEDIFQNVALKALTKEVSFEASFIASAAVAGDVIILRSLTHLYCVAEDYEMARRP